MQKILIIFIALFFTITAFAQEEQLNYRIRHSLVIDPTVSGQFSFGDIESWEVTTRLRITSDEDPKRKKAKLDVSKPENLKKLANYTYKEPHYGTVIKPEYFKSTNLNLS